MSGAFAGPLREGLETGKDVLGRSFVHDTKLGGVHTIPPGIEPGVLAAVAARATEDDVVRRWLEARHLIGSERVGRVETWGLARTPRPGGGDEVHVSLVPGSRFTCHGCGACCETYVYAPVTEAEKKKVLDQQAKLAPHVKAKPEEWFTVYNDWKNPDGSITYALGRQPSGACVFLAEDKLCQVHRHLGGLEKPLTCQAFPIALTHRPDGLVASLRIECATFSRSRDDGQPLEQQLEWVTRIVAGGRRKGTHVPAVVQVAGDIYVPFPLARSIERRAIGYLRGAPTIELAHLAIRDLIFATIRALKPSPDVAAIEQAENLATQASMEQLAELAGDIDPRVAIKTLGKILGVVLRATPKFLSLRSVNQSGTLPEAQDKLSVAVMKTFYGAFHERFGWPRVAELDDASIEEGKKVAQVDARKDDPKVLDFVRECFVQIVGASRPLGTPGGLVYGYAAVALHYWLGRWAARLVAFRRGADQCTPHDWNTGLALMDRTLSILDMSGNADGVSLFYAHLFESPDVAW